jgi:antitoxin component YwqK of YwqJK toxin-antitoxin module
MKVYNIDGRLAGVSRWNKGKALSSVLLYPNGNFHVISYSDTLFNSLFIVEYYCDGKIKETHVPIDTSGATNSILYNRKGIKVLEHIYNGGKREFKTFFDNGTISTSGYVNNTYPFLVGEWNSYFLSRAKHVKGFYDNYSRKTGKWYTWDENGKLLKTEEYNKGELIKEEKY